MAAASPFLSRTQRLATGRPSCHQRHGLEAGVAAGAQSARSSTSASRFRARGCNGRTYISLLEPRTSVCRPLCGAKPASDPPVSSSTPGGMSRGTATGPTNVSASSKGWPVRLPPVRAQPPQTPRQRPRRRQTIALHGLATYDRTLCTLTNVRGTKGRMALHFVPRNRTRTRSPSLTRSGARIRAGKA